MYGHNTALVGGVLMERQGAVVSGIFWAFWWWRDERIEF